MKQARGKKKGRQKEWGKKKEEGKEEWGKGREREGTEKEMLFSHITYLWKSCL